MIVKILKGTCGAFRMAYFEGMEADLPDSQAELLIGAGYAVKISDSIIEQAVIEKPENPEQTKRRGRPAK